MAVPAGFLSSAYTQPGDLTTKKGLSRALGGQYEYNMWDRTNTANQRGAEHGQVSQGYSDLYNNPMSNQEANNLRSGALTPLGGAYNTAREQAERHLASTGNNAGYGSYLGELTRQQGRDAAQTGFGVESDIANQKYQRKMAGLQGLASLFGVDTSYLESLNGNQNQLIGAGNDVESRRKGVLGTITGIENLIPGLRPAKG